MTVEKIMNMDGVVNDKTEIFIRQGEGFKVISHGVWFQDHILDHMQDDVESFTWQDDNKLYIDIK